MSADDKSIKLAIAAGQAAKSKKATEVIALDVSQRLVLTDMFVLATGNNERQVRAIVDAVDEAMTRAGVKLLRREGLAQAHWVLLDYGVLVVHVQQEDDREFYALERLWADAPVIEVPDPDQPGAQIDRSVPSSTAEQVPTPISPLELIGEDFS